MLIVIIITVIMISYITYVVCSDFTPTLELNKRYEVSAAIILDAKLYAAK